MPVGRYPTQMLQFGWMKPADAAALFSYLRSNFGNSAPPVDAAAVAGALGPVTPPTTIHAMVDRCRAGGLSGRGRETAFRLGGHG